MPVLLIVAVLVAWFVYGFTAEDGPAAAPPSTKLPPAPTLPMPRRGLVVTQDGDHQCYVEARANGAPVRFLLDTGAWTVSFGPSHLAALGIDPHSIAYDQRITTANGLGRAANIRLRRLEVAGLVLRDVPAQVTERGTLPLLGASVLRHLKVEFGRGVCVLLAAGDEPR
jgi:aspartyl protease family protein